MRQGLMTDRPVNDPRVLYSSRLLPEHCDRQPGVAPHLRNGRIALVGPLPRLAPAFHGSERLSQRRAQSLPGRPAAAPGGTPLATASSPIASASASTAAPSPLRSD